MNVCLDYQPAVSQGAGIGRYTRALARGLPPLLAAEDALRLFYLDFRRAACAPDVPGATAVAWRRLPGAWLQQSWKRLGWPPYDRLAPAADCYHFPNFIIPPLRRGRAVVTIHDMSFARLPDCAEPRNLAYLRARLPDTIRRADAIIAISQFSAAEIVADYPAAENKVHAIPLGIEPDRFQRPDAGVVNALRTRLQLDRPYLLTVGTIEPRKNLPLLIDTFDALPAFDGDLVIAGMPGWKCEPIFEAMRQARRADRIRYLRYVADADLPALYAGATLFALPSRYEGFGFTPLEAMACGVPVVASTGGSLPEVLGEAAVLIEDASVDAWAPMLRALLGDPTRLQRLAEAGPVRAARFRWTETARETLRVYRSVCA